MPIAGILRAVWSTRGEYHVEALVVYTLGLYEWAFIPGRREHVSNPFSCDEEERVYFKFFLMTGMREQEVIYTFWENINVKQGVVTVTAKPGHGFSPKDYEEREIPIPDELVALLSEWKRKHEHGSPFIFPTRNGAAKFDFLDICERIGKRAKLNPDEFWLHKFRATFATMHLRAGVDLRTVRLG